METARKAPAIILAYNIVRTYVKSAVSVRKQLIWEVEARTKLDIVQRLSLFK